MNKKVCVVVGVGPGTGAATARAFAREGYHVVMMARNTDKLTALAQEIGARAYSVDAADEASLQAGFASVRNDLGAVHTLVWNVGSGVFGDLDKVDADDLRKAFSTGALGLFVAAKAVVDDMRAAGEGNILVTGATASLRGKPFTTAFAPAKAAQRSLAQALARQLGPSGIHVGLVIVDGMIDLDGTRARMPDAPDEKFIAPDAIAQTFVMLSNQPRTAWTFELDVRPHVENW